MNLLKKPCRSLPLGLLMASIPAHAMLYSSSVTDAWNRGNIVSLIDSRVKATVGPAWVDVEEEAELQVSSDAYNSDDAVEVMGTLSLPPHAALVGALLWNNDTLLMGKLRGHQDAEHIYDSLVPSLPSNYARDPLLLEMQNDSTYKFQLYPFTPGGSRRFRIRYLLPRTTSRDFEIKPLLARMVNGSVPSQFVLQVRGTRTDVRLATDSGLWPLSLPADRRMALSSSSGIRLRFGSVDTTAPLAVRAHVDSGAWQGDYVFYNAKVPDSILTKVGLRSETVVLWRWIHPELFLGISSYDTTRYVTDYGSKAITQAQNLVAVGDLLTGRGDRFGLVADMGLNDSVQVYPIADSGTTGYRTIKSFLSGINSDYLKWRIPKSSGSSSGNANDLELSRNRLRFRTDLQTVGTLYSADSSIIRHLVVVTVGPVPSGGDEQEIPDSSLLPHGVSVTTSDLVWSGSWNNGRYTTSMNSASWPGVNLTELAAERPGTGKLAVQNGVSLPVTKTVISATLSMQAGSSRLYQETTIHKGSDGAWRAGLQFHSLSLGNSVRWDFWNNGDSVGSYTATPSWESAAGDSVLPRLWARAEVPSSTVFLNKELGPIFGVVDPLYSLLATPSDSVGKTRQKALTDSGVPFLSSQDIFLRTGYGSDAAGISAAAVNVSRFSATYLASRRVVRIDFAGLAAVSAEILDLRGRTVARWNGLTGRMSLEWDLRDLSGQTVPRGMYFVRLHTTNARLSAKVLIH